MEASGNLPTVDLTSGAALTLLGPTRAKLAAFELAKLEQKQLEVLRERVRPIPAPGQVEGIALQRNEPDIRKPNGTSIAFVVQYKSRRALFLRTPIPTTWRTTSPAIVVQRGARPSTSSKSAITAARETTPRS